jgi:hypothetical protein
MYPWKRIETQTEFNSEIKNFQVGGAETKVNECLRLLELHTRELVKLIRHCHYTAEAKLIVNPDLELLEKRTQELRNETWAKLLVKLDRYYPLIRFLSENGPGGVELPHSLVQLWWVTVKFKTRLNGHVPHVIDGLLRKSTKDMLSECV